MEARRINLYCLIVPRIVAEVTEFCVERAWCHPCVAGTKRENTKRFANNTSIFVTFFFVCSTYLQSSPAVSECYNLFGTICTTAILTFCHVHTNQSIIKTINNLYIFYKSALQLKAKTRAYIQQYHGNNISITKTKQKKEPGWKEE